MITRGKTKINIDIEKIKKLPYVRYPVDMSSWPEARFYPEHQVTGSLCSDKTAEENNIEWDWTNELRVDSWQVCALSFYNLPPGHVTPWHRDDYKKFISYYQTGNKDILRRLLFLEDSVPGQLFMFDDLVIDHWSAGDWIQWTAEHRHMGTNHSDKNRFTCQLTGYII